MSQVIALRSETYDPISPVIDGCCETIRRCIDTATFLQQYCSDLAPEIVRGMTAHLRHSYEIYLGILAGTENTTIDYQARKRDPELEKQIDKLVDAFTELEEELETYRTYPSDMEVTIRDTSNQNGMVSEMKSTLGRELHGAASHALHHIALIAALLQTTNYELPRELTLAFSTKQYERRAQPR